VTGTSSGIGAAVASHLLEAEWTVIGVARRPGPIEHPRYRHVAVDLSNFGSALPSLDAAIGDALGAREWRRVGLVNNAALGGSLGPVERIDAGDFQRILAVNVVAATHLMGLFVARTPVRAALRIVNVSSGAAVRPFPGLAAYAASKAAMRMAGMVLAAELESAQRNSGRPDDVAIVSYEPGAVDTAMQSGARALSNDEFPWVGLFHDFAARGMLVSPDQPAAEIVRLLESGSRPAFSEERLGRR
jgi:benzil reductase ((S)-benzoin forming)